MLILYDFFLIFQHLCLPLNNFFIDGFFRLLINSERLLRFFRKWTGLIVSGNSLFDFFEHLYLLVQKLISIFDRLRFWRHLLFGYRRRGVVIICSILLLLVILFPPLVLHGLIRSKALLYFLLFYCIFFEIFGKFCAQFTRLTRTFIRRWSLPIHEARSQFHKFILQL